LIPVPKTESRVPYRISNYFDPRLYVCGPNIELVSRAIPESKRLASVVKRENAHLVYRNTVLDALVTTDLYVFESGLLCEECRLQ
jgi:hypothetical protein